MTASIIERDALVGNLLDRVDELERRIRYMEDTHPGVGGEAAGKLAYYREDGSLHLPGLLYSEENAMWGYYDRLADQIVVADSAAGDITVNHTAVPAGEVWVVTGASVYASYAAATHYLRGQFGATGMLVYYYGTLGAGIYSCTPPMNVILKPADYLFNIFGSAPLHSVLVANIWGYKMQVA